MSAHLPWDQDRREIFEQLVTDILVALDDWTDLRDGPDVDDARDAVMRELLTFGSGGPTDGLGPFDSADLVRWAEMYGHPEEWVKRAQSAHGRAERAQRTAVDLQNRVLELTRERAAAVESRENANAATLRAEGERDRLAGEVERLREALTDAEKTLRHLQPYAGLLVQYLPQVTHRVAVVREKANVALAPASDEIGETTCE